MGRRSENLDSGVRRNDNKGSRDGSAKRETDAEQVIGNFRDAFADRLYGLIARHRREEDILSEARLRACAARFDFSLVAANEVLYHSLARRRLQDVLTAIRHGFRRGLRPKLKPNAEYGLKAAPCFRATFRR